MEMKRTDRKVRITDNYGKTYERYIHEEKRFYQEYIKFNNQWVSIEKLNGQLRALSGYIISVERI